MAFAVAPFCSQLLLLFSLLLVSTGTVVAHYSTYCPHVSTFHGGGECPL